MNQTEFDNIGKRMPYTTPEGFFDSMEDNIWQAVKPDFQGTTSADAPNTLQVGRKPVKLSVVMRSAIAVAASIVLVFVVSMKVSAPSHTSLNDVDQAFSQLSTDDQAYLLNVYQEDIFINE